MSREKDDTIFKKNTRNELGDGARDVCTAYLRSVHD